MAQESSDSLLRQWLKMLLFLGFLAALGIVLVRVLLFPSSVRRYTLDVQQNAQFHSMEAALELFNHFFDGYPPSDANDPLARPYCGAMKLAEALVGRDLLGFHKDSVFRADCKDADGLTELYLPMGVSCDRTMNLTARKGPYLPPESADCLTLAQIYGPGNTGPFDPNLRVLCDVFRRTHTAARKAGMPVLYYKADVSKTAHDVNDPDNPDNIYNYRDNHALLALGVPGEPEKKHPLFVEPKLFYKITKSDKSANVARPVRPDSYILISAGKDGLYGTGDDICNFDFRFPKQ